MKNIRFSEDCSKVVIIDQTLLPNEEREICLASLDGMCEAVASLRVRGAPAIGIFAAHCLSALAQGLDLGLEGFYQKIGDFAGRLNATRPTAVNLGWALSRMLAVAKSGNAGTVEGVKAKLREEALAIQREDASMCAAIAGHGLSLVKPGDGILTHCNAGPLATSEYGTALGPILLGAERGIKFRVFAGETRPLMQGARLTAYELQKAGVDVTLACDNMAASLMKSGKIDACFVGCDRVAANGDTANKIGTLGVAVLAKHFGIPFYVLGPSSTIDFACASGDDIVIEERGPDEIKEKFFRQPMAPKNVKCYNPAFDVTGHELISAIVTEHGVSRPCFAESLQSHKRAPLQH